MKKKRITRLLAAAGAVTVLICLGVWLRPRSTTAKQRVQIRCVGNIKPTEQNIGSANDQLNFILQNTFYLPLPNGVSGCSFSLYAPSSIAAGTNFVIRGKVNTNTNGILNYLHYTAGGTQTSVDASATGPVSVDRLTLELYATPHAEVISTVPHASRTVISRLPYSADSLSPENPTGFRVISDLIPGSAGLNYKSVTVFDFNGTLTAAQTDWGSNTPNETQTGISVTNIMRYLGTSSWVPLYGKATVVISYSGIGPRPDSVVYKTVTLNSFITSGAVNIH